MVVTAQRNGMKLIQSFTKDNFFLSNFYICPVTYEDVEYPSSEHAYQAAKSLDIDVRLAVRKKVTPGKAKQLGRALVVRSDWDEVKVSVMKDILKAKFFPTGYLANKLLETKDAMLIEGNTWGDSFWGVYNNFGTNMLGKLLMQIREDLGSASGKESGLIS